MVALWRFWLEHHGRQFELTLGETLLGRGEMCQVVVDDGLVSRRHALIVCSEDEARIEDAGSSNGVFVNGEKETSRVLHDGDIVRLGQQDITFRAVELRTSPAARAVAETLHGVDAASARGNPFEVLGKLVDKMLVMGRGEEAERMLETVLKKQLVVARAAEAPDAVTEQAVDYASRLADATGKAEWVDYAFEMYSELGAPLPADVIERLYTTLRRVKGVSLSGYRDYVEVLNGAGGRFGPRERFLVQRITNLERLVV